MLICFSLAIFSQNVCAQDVAKDKPKTLTQEEIDKREVTKFADLFMQNLEKYKDFNKISKSFFISDFKTHFSKVEDWSIIDENVSKQLDSSEIYKARMLMFNFIYLTILYSFGDDKPDVSKNSNDESMFPPNVIEVIKRNIILSPLLIDRDIEPKIQNIQEYKNFVNAFKTVVEAQRQFFGLLSQKLRIKYAKNIVKTRKRFKDYHSELCKAEHCEGLPQNTQIFNIAAFPLSLDVIKERGRYKIFKIYLYDN